MTSASYLPHIEMMLQALRISRDRLDSRSKIAVDPRFLLHLLRQIARSLPFDATFYLAAYDDVAQAHGNGEIGDLHAHYIEVGFLEGRLGTIPKVDAEYYLNTYPDVSQAIASGQVGSAEEHYIHRGVTEGRSPSPIAEPAVVRWMTVLRPDG